MLNLDRTLIKNKMTKTLIVLTREKTGEEIVVPCEDYKFYSPVAGKEIFKDIFREVYPEQEVVGKVDGVNVSGFYTCDDGETYITWLFTDKKEKREFEVDDKKSRTSISSMNENPPIDKEEL